MQRVDQRTDAEIYAAHATELTVFARSLVGPSDAADVVADAVVSALASPGWTAVENHRAYLYRSVWNRAQTFLFRRSKRPSIEGSVATRQLTEDITVGSAHPELIDAVEALSAQQRAVVALTYWRDLPIGEVAEILAISDGAVRKHLARARAQLRKVLDDR